MDFIKEIYKRRVQSEIESYKDYDVEVKKDKIQAKDLFFVDRILIQLKLIDWLTNILANNLVEINLLIPFKVTKSSYFQKPKI